MNPCASPLLTDMYELSMVQAYCLHARTQTAVFEFFVRTLPATRNFLLAAGLEQALVFLERLHFSPAELEWIQTCGHFRPGFSDYLSRLRFTGDVHAMSEGTPFFADEPILRVTAPLPVAQLVETRLINILQFQTMVASKAARYVLAAPGKRLVDFGLSRAHGAEAGLLAARASYLAGFTGTSAALAASVFGIPVFGTMAHSFVQAYDDEDEAFSAYAQACPEDVTLLLDTYDTEAAAEKVVSLARGLESRGIKIAGVRIGSGNLALHARRVRDILDRGGCRGVRIFASGNLDECEIARLAAQGAPIDGFGVGVELVTSGDAPSLDCTYRLQEYAGRPRRKRSEGKTNWPGRKQIYRISDAAGRMRSDMLCAGEDAREGEALLSLVMRSGKRLRPSPALRTVRERALRQLERLPAELQVLSKAEAYPVEVSPLLLEMTRRLDQDSASAGRPLSRR